MEVSIVCYYNKWGQYINWKIGAMVTQRFAKPYIGNGMWVRFPHLPPNKEDTAGLAGDTV